MSFPGWSRRVPDRGQDGHHACRQVGEILEHAARPAECQPHLPGPDGTIVGGAKGRGAAAEVRDEPDGAVHVLGLYSNSRVPERDVGVRAVTLSFLTGSRSAPLIIAEF